MKVMVVGGGIGGLTTALCCARQGMEVHLFEQASEFSEVGAGIQLSPNGTRILHRLGLENSLEKYSFHPQSLDMRIGTNGSSVFSIPISDADSKYGAPYLHIHRADLLAVLLEAVKHLGNCYLYTNHKLVSIDECDSKVTLHFENGDSSDGDIVVGADGIHSKVREDILGLDNPRFTGNVAWRAVIPSSSVSEGLIPPTATVWTGNKKHAVTYYLRDGELINFVGIIEQKNWKKESWTEEGAPDELVGEFAEFCVPIRSVLKNVTHCFKWALHDRNPLKKWSIGRRVILGDAAHPMLPFLAQGAVMAIEDAEMLSSCLMKESLDNALIVFEKNRKHRTSKVQLRARSNMRLFHHGTPMSRLINYAPIKFAASIAPQFVHSRQDWLYTYDAENPN